MTLREAVKLLDALARNTAWRDQSLIEQLQELKILLEKAAQLVGEIIEDFVAVDIDPEKVYYGEE